MPLAKKEPIKVATWRLWERNNMEERKKKTTADWCNTCLCMSEGKNVIEDENDETRNIALSVVDHLLIL